MPGLGEGKISDICKPEVKNDLGLLGLRAEGNDPEKERCQQCQRIIPTVDTIKAEGVVEKIPVDDWTYMISPLPDEQPRKTE